MVTEGAVKKKSPVKKKKRAKPTLTKKIQAATEPAPPKGMVGQVASMAGRMLDVGASSVTVARTLRSATVVAKALRGGHPFEAAGEVLRAITPSSAQTPRALAKT